MGNNQSGPEKVKVKDNTLPLDAQPAKVFDEAFRKNMDAKCDGKSLREIVQKPRILLCGMHGAGKSTLINRFLSSDATGRARESKNEKGVHNPGSDIYESEFMIMHDAQGFEGKDKEYFSMVADFLRERHLMSGADQGQVDKLAEEIHVIWFLHDLSGPRAFAEWEPEFLKAIEDFKVPIILVLSKLDKLLADEDFEDEDIIQRVKLITKNLQAPFSNVKGLVMLGKTPKKEHSKKRFEEFVSTALKEVDDGGLAGALPVKFGEAELSKETINVLDTIALESFMYSFVMGQSVDFESKVTASIRHSFKRTKKMTVVSLAPILGQGGVFYLANALVSDVMDIWEVPESLRKTLSNQAWWDNVETNTRWLVNKAVLTFSVIGIPEAIWSDVQEAQTLATEVAMKSCIFCGKLFLKYGGEMQQATAEDAVEAMAAVQAAVKDINDFVKGLGWGDLFKKDKVAEAAIAKRVLDLMRH